jgi:hypothetical protein
MSIYIIINIMAYLLKARTVESEKEPLQANGHEQTTEQRRLLDIKFLINKNRRPLLGNGSVNRFPRQRIHMQQRNSVFYVVCGEML